MRRAAVYLLIFFFVQLAAGALSLHPALSGGDLALARALLALECAALFAVALSHRVRGRFPWLSAGPVSAAVPAAKGGVPLLLVAVLALNVATALVLLPFGVDDGGSSRRFAALSCSWEAMLLLCAIGPVFEEVVFRHGMLRGFFGENLWTGVPEGRFSAIRSRAVFAVVLSAAVFALAHMNWLQGLSAFVMGCAFGALYLCRRSLVLSVAAHMLCNTLAFLSLLYPAAERMLAARVPGWMLVASGLGLGAAAVMSLIKKLRLQ